MTELTVIWFCKIIKVIRELQRRLIGLTLELISLQGEQQKRKEKQSFPFDRQSLAFLTTLCRTVAAALDDACASHPCRNAGTCIVDRFNPTVHTCQCVRGFEGQNCEVAVAKPFAIGKIIRPVDLIE